MKKTDTWEYAVFQIDPSISEKAEKALYHSLDVLDRFGIQIEPSMYKLVYTGKNTEQSKTDVLDSIYCLLNNQQLYPPEDYRGRRVGLSDVVVLHRNGEDNTSPFFCDSCGFVPLKAFSTPDHLWCA